MDLARVNFLIVGAAKSATTWLQRVLQDHPAVYMPDPELHYFSREYHRGHAWYLSQFQPPGNGLVIGEKSNSYLDSTEAAERIRIAVPDAGFVAQLRNPVDRAYSDYCMLYRRGEVGRDVERYLDPRVEPRGRFLVGGHYRQQLDRYFQRFPAERILVLLLDDVAADPAAQMARVYRHLELAPHWPESVRGRVKEKKVPMLHPMVRRYLAWSSPVLAPIWNSAPLGPLRRLLVGEIAYPPLTSDLRGRLRDYYAPEIEELGRLLNRDMSAWTAATADRSQLDP